MNRYAQSRTGLFHLVSSDKDITMCGTGLPVADKETPPLQLVDSGMAQSWLNDHSWDLCLRCREAGRS